MTRTDFRSDCPGSEGLGTESTALVSDAGPPGGRGDRYYRLRRSWSGYESACLSLARARARAESESRVLSSNPGPVPWHSLRETELLVSLVRRSGTPDSEAAAAVSVTSLARRRGPTGPGPRAPSAAADKARADADRAAAVSSFTEVTTGNKPERDRQARSTDQFTVIAPGRLPVGARAWAQAQGSEQA